MGMIQVKRKEVNRIKKLLTEKKMKRSRLKKLGPMD